MPDTPDCGGKAPALTVAQARQTLLDAVTPVVGWEQVPIRSALGRILRQDVVAPFDVPAHDNSAMDGFAARAADLGARPSERSWRTSWTPPCDGGRRGRRRAVAGGRGTWRPGRQLLHTGALRGGNERGGPGYGGLEKVF